MLFSYLQDWIVSICTSCTKKKPQPESCKYPDPCEVANDCKEAFRKLGIDNFQKFKPCMSVCDVLKIGALVNNSIYQSHIDYCNPFLFWCRFNFDDFCTSIFTEVKSLPKFQLRVDECSCLFKVISIPLTLPKFSPYRTGIFSLSRKTVRCRSKSGLQ